MRLEERLAKEGVLIYSNVGDSMMPLLKEGRDRFVVKPKGEGRLRRLDVPLYRRDDDVEGKYVLHRVLWVRKKDYIIAGDNRRWVEMGIEDRHVVGVLKGVIRNGRVIEVDKDWRYRLYAHLWGDFFLLKAAIFYVLDFCNIIGERFSKDKVAYRRRHPRH